jgi:hypothetical protein
MSDFNIWLEEALVSHEWDTDLLEVQHLMSAQQGVFMSMYAAGASQDEVSQAFLSFWRRASAVLS